MPEMPNSSLINRSFSKNLSQNIENLKEILHVPENEDAIFREFQSGNLRICLIYIEGMADDKKISEFILHAIKVSRETENIDLRQLSESMIEMAQVRNITENKEAVPAILAGMTCLLMDGSNEALLMETRNYPFRAVSQPTTEAVIGGPHEAFNEHLRTNVSLVRRYVQSPELISQRMTVGTRVPTQLFILYLNGVASDASVKEIKRRLKCIQAPVVHSLGEIQQLIEDHPYALLPQMLETERPDRTAAALEEGQIAILVENAPYALIAPVTVFHMIHAPDDSFMRWQYGSCLRIVRTLGILISLLLPAMYVAISLYHTHLIPMSLLSSIAESRVNVPFSVVAEVLFMEFAFFLLNEASLRTPTQMGSAFGIVGALVLGQAAVSASIISPILIIIIALTGLGDYAVPNFGFAMGLRIYRIALVLISAFLGIYGIVAGSFLILLHLCSMKSFGADYLAPVAPKRVHNPDILLRFPAKMQKHIMYFAAHNSWIQQKGTGQK